MKGGGVYNLDTRYTMSALVSSLVSGKEDGVVGVPAEGAVPPRVRAVVHVVRARGRVRRRVRVTGGGGGRGG